MAEQKNTTRDNTANNAVHPKGRDIPPGFLVELFKAQNRPVTYAERQAFNDWYRRQGGAA